MNIQAIQNLNTFLAIGAILLQIFSFVTLAILFFSPKEYKKNKYLNFIDKHILIIGFLIAFTSSVFPLVYSEIVHFLPCFLCWWQRVFMFSSFVLFATALWDKDRRVVRYVTPLISIGFLISIYHNFNYYFGETNAAPCDASGVSCYQHLVSVFNGYISIPMLALTAFFALLTLLAVAHFYKKEA